MTNQETGRRGEDIAANYLVEHGYRIVQRNWRCPVGEIDIIVRDRDGTAIVVEVKTRRYGEPDEALEAITPVKLERLHHLARLWAAEHDTPRAGVPPRVDAIGIVLERGRVAAIRHVKAVF